MPPALNGACLLVRFSGTLDNMARFLLTLEAGFKVGDRFILVKYSYGIYLYSAGILDPIGLYNTTGGSIC